MKVNLWKCDRCGLVFVSDDVPNVCMACLRHYSGTTVIRLLGREIQVESVRIYGDAAMRKATRGFGALSLGIRCPHGWAADYLCSECNVTA